MSMYFSVVISPATTTSPVVISVSHATRLFGSFASAASSTASEIWSAILSGWPSVTDSEVKRYSSSASCCIGGISWVRVVGLVVVVVGRGRLGFGCAGQLSAHVGGALDHGPQLGPGDVDGQVAQ